jgi:hypothetical protein
VAAAVGGAGVGGESMGRKEEEERSRGTRSVRAMKIVTRGVLRNRTLSARGSLKSCEDAMPKHVLARVFLAKAAMCSSTLQEIYCNPVSEINAWISEFVAMIFHGKVNSSLVL